MKEPLIFDISREGRRAFAQAPLEVAAPHLAGRPVPLSRARGARAQGHHATGVLRVGQAKGASAGKLHLAGVVHVDRHHLVAPRQGQERGARGLLRARLAEQRLVPEVREQEEERAAPDRALHPGQRRAQPGPAAGGRTV